MAAFVSFDPYKFLLCLRKAVPFMLRKHHMSPARQIAELFELQSTPLAASEAFTRARDIVADILRRDLPDDDLVQSLSALAQILDASATSIRNLTTSRLIRNEAPGPVSSAVIAAALMELRHGIPALLDSSRMLALSQPLERLLDVLVTVIEAGTGVHSGYRGNAKNAREITVLACSAAAAVLDSACSAHAALRERATQCLATLLHAA